MNVVFSSDNNYIRHLGVAVYSLLSKNDKCPKIRIFVIDNEISRGNKDKLTSVVEVFPNSSIEYIPFKQWRDSLKLDMPWNISLSSYGRLFVASMLPKDVDRVLYLDCDMIVTQPLNDLWNYDLKGNVIAAVQDAVPDRFKYAVGLRSEDRYFNAGLLLIDLKKWRETDCERKCLDFIRERQGRVFHHDQGVLNGVFRNSLACLPLKFNVMTVQYIFNRRKIMKYFCEHTDYYAAEEIDEAKQNPAILHFTPSFTVRPWVRGCKHPLKNLYWNCLAQTPWKGAAAENDKSKWYIRLIDWRYRSLPF
ncbi:MAG: glycosyltransferase family 8 protein [Bacteroidales bacterium]|nr:glycosyltransferase family 8 protein [Bacteroidales bacterium]